MALEVLHADNHLLAVVKSAGVPVVPDASGDPSLLEEARAWVEREYAKPGRAFLGVVQRLDRPVSGVVLFARTSKAAARLTEAFKRREVEKVYWGLTRVAPEPAAGELEQWLFKDRSTNRVRVVRPETPDARRARTRWRVLRQGGRGASRRVLVELVPETGRSHQLRVAAASLGAPLLGDLKYGDVEPLVDKSIGLHARSLTVDHPTRDERPCFTCPPPALADWEVAGDA